MRPTLLLLAACGRIGFDPVGDAVPDALGAFSAPVVVPELSDPSFSDDDPTVTSDLREMYFASLRPGGAGGMGDIWVSTRNTPDDPWGVPVPVVQLNSADEDESPGISADGLTIYFMSARPGGPVGRNIWVATRMLRTDPWSAPTLVAELSSPDDDYQAQPSVSGLRLVMYRDALPQRDLFEAGRATSGALWSTPTSLTAVNTSSEERSPCLDASDREIWFSSDRNASPGIHDIFTAVRTDPTQAFGLAIAVPHLNSSADDDDPWLSPDGRVIYFSSNRTGNREIYEAQR